MRVPKACLIPGFAERGGRMFFDAVAEGKVDKAEIAAFFRDTT